MSRHLLVVCTANVCRSPIAALLLRKRLAECVDTDGASWVVSSAATTTGRAGIDRHTVAAGVGFGVDLASHEPRHLTPAILANDGADMVLAMTREHLRHVVGIDREAWSRTFTLREVVRRASMRPAGRDEPPGVWLQALGMGRRAADMLRPDPCDDVDDPYGGHRGLHDEMVAEIAGLVDRLVELGPWRAGY